MYGDVVETLEVDGGTIRVPAGASVIRWVLVPGSGRAEIRSFALNDVR